MFTFGVFRVKGLGFGGVKGLGFRAWCLGFIGFGA